MDGDDCLVGGRSNDLLINDGSNIAETVVTGADAFYFAKHRGSDQIGDSDIGQDTMDVSGYLWAIDVP